MAAHGFLGFFALSYNDGSLVVLDMRGPNFILQDTNSSNRQHSFLKHSTPDPLVSLSWAIFKLSSGQSDDSPLVPEI